MCLNNVWNFSSFKINTYSFIKSKISVFWKFHGTFKNGPNAPFMNRDVPSFPKILDILFFVHNFEWLTPKPKTELPRWRMVSLASKARKIDFVRNRFPKATANFFVIILNIIFKRLIGIKIIEQLIVAFRKKFFFGGRFLNFHICWKSLFFQIEEMSVNNSYWPRIQKYRKSFGYDILI